VVKQYNAAHGNACSLTNVHTHKNADYQQWECQWMCYHMLCGIRNKVGDWVLTGTYHFLNSELIDQHFGGYCVYIQNPSRCTPTSGRAYHIAKLEPIKLPNFTFRTIIVYRNMWDQIQTDRVRGDSDCTRKVRYACLIIVITTHTTHTHIYTNKKCHTTFKGGHMNGHS
jgi:hypothetical protein